MTTIDITTWHWEEATEARLQVFTKNINWLLKLTHDEVIILPDGAQEGIGH